MVRVPVVFVALAVISLTACSAPSGPTRIAVSAEHCGEGWSNSHAGQQTFVLGNDDTATAEVYLTDARTGAVYAYVDDLAPQSTADLRIDLGGGRYAFRCAISDRGVAVGRTVAVSGPASTGPRPVEAVTENDLIPLTKEYASWVSARLVELDALAVTLDGDLQSGDAPQAKVDWLAAHVLWEQLGAAYNAFGARGNAIDDSFQSIEAGLWGTAGNPGGDALVRDVAALAEEPFQVEPLDLSIRAHEIVEDALRFELTGANDHGSGSTFQTVGANLAGTAKVLGLLEPVLKPRYPGLAQTTAALAQAVADVGAVQGVPLAGLSTAQRERINADLSQLAEDLAPIASICEPRRTR